MSLSTAAHLIKPTTTTEPINDFQGHADWVTSVAFSPNGQNVLTGSLDNTAKLWNVDNGTIVHTFQEHTYDVASVAFSPNGQYVLTGSDDETAKLWNAINGTVVHTFEGHTGFVRSVTFSPNGQHVLTGSFDDTVKLWNVQDGTVVHTFQGHASPVWSVAFSPNGLYALTGSNDKTAKLWNVDNGTIVHTFQEHTKSVTSVAISPNGQYALTGSLDKTAKLWNTNNGTIIHTFQGHINYVTSVAFSPNGEYALTGSYDKTAKLWNINNGTIMHTFQGHTDSVDSVAFSPNGEFALTGSFDETAKLWQLPESVVASTGPPKSVSPLSTSKVVTHPQQTSQAFTSHSDPSSPLLSNAIEFVPTPDSATETTSTSAISLHAHESINSDDVSSPEGKIKHLMSMGFANTRARRALESCDLNLERAVEFLLDRVSIDSSGREPLGKDTYNSINFALLDKLDQQGDRFLDIINNATTVESGMHLLSQYPEELQSLLYEKSQSELEKKELKAIMKSQEHYQFYTHFIRKLNGMMTACETINSGMVSQADVSFQDYVHGLVKEGAGTALQQICLGKVLGGVIQLAKRQFSCVPFTDAIGSFFQIACEFKSKRDQHLAVGRVAIMTALADLQEHDRGGINGTVHRIGRYIVRAEATQLASFESEKFGCMQHLWAKATGDLVNTPAQERGCNVADLVIGVIMNPTENTDLYNILEGHTINQSALLSETIVAAALDITIEDVQNLEFFSSKEDITDDSNKSPTSTPAEQSSDNTRTSNMLTENKMPNHTSSNNASGVATIEEVQRIKKTMLEMQKRNESMRMKYNDVQMKYDDVQMKYENVTRQVAKMKKGNKGTEVGVGGGLAQEYVNPHETSGQKTSTTKLMDHLEKRLIVMETNLLEANKTILEHEEHFDLVETNKKKGTTKEEHNENSRDAEEKRKRIERERRELFD